MTTVSFDSGLVERYGGPGPRYTSYPTALQFTDRFGEADHRRYASQSNRETRAAPLSVYLHIPFCHSLCYYCGCTKIVTRNAARVNDYMDRLNHEIELQGELFAPDRVVDQLHLGGGTPTYLSAVEMHKLVSHLGGFFNLQRDGDHEYSIEIDPRSVRPDYLDELAELGFNRLSMGIQDFDPTVQQAVNRKQSFAEVAGLTERARAVGFKSVSFDLIYGLPRQSVASFSRTLERVVDILPDRIAVYNYAHLPQRFKGQRMIREDELPALQIKLRILRETLARLTDASYEYIGMDHFALPGDELSIAQKDGTLQRNFQGYSTHGDCDLVGMGLSSISHIGDSFSQNVTTTAAYAEALDAGRLPVYRGLELHDDDRRRAAIIQQVMCFNRIDFEEYERRFGHGFQDYFGAELARLEPLQHDGLLDIGERAVEVTTKGRLLLRTIAGVFDRYSSDPALSERFSQTI